MSIFTTPVEAFDYLLNRANAGKPRELDEVFDAERGEDLHAIIGTGVDFSETMTFSDHGLEGAVGEAALRLVSLTPGFRDPFRTTAPRLFIRARLTVPDSRCLPGPRFSVARYHLTQEAVRAVIAGEEPHDPNYSLEWVQGWGPAEQFAHQAGFPTDHDHIVSEAQARKPGLLTMLSRTERGIFRLEELVTMATYIQGR